MSMVQSQIKFLRMQGDICKLSGALDDGKMLYDAADTIEQLSAKLQVESSVKMQDYLDFAHFVAREIFDENWEFNSGAFAEIACRKLNKLGIVSVNGDSWHYDYTDENDFDIDWQAQ